jgi:hypothetical protein
MKLHDISLLLSAISVAEGTLALLITMFGVLAAFLVTAFVSGVFAGMLISYCIAVRRDS